MSYRLARVFLSHAFPGGECLPESSVKATVRRIDDRLEADAHDATAKAWKTLLPYRDSPESESGVAIQIDAGYIKAAPRQDRSRWFGAVASKLSVPGVTRTHVHAYVGNSDPMQGARQRAFMQSVGIGLRVPVTVLTDGGSDVNQASRLPTGADRLLDWFHIGMRFEHLRLAVAGLRSLDDRSRAQLRRRIDGAKWLLWHGKKERCLEQLQALRRETGWAGNRNALGRLICYLQSCWNILADYACGRARKLPISTAGASTSQIFKPVLLTRRQNPVVKESRCKLLLSPSGQVTLATDLEVKSTVDFLDFMSDYIRCVPRFSRQFLDRWCYMCTKSA